MSEVRMKPDGTDVGIRNSGDKWFPWRITSGGRYSDSQVADWIVLVVSAPAPQ